MRVIGGGGFFLARLIAGKGLEHAEVEIGLARGKRSHDKRETIKRRESDRELARMKRRGGRYKE